MTDRCQAQKWESSDKGGTDDDPLPSEINPNQDGLDARALFVQSDESSDSDVYVSRNSSDNLIFKDKVVSTEKTLSELVSGGGGITADQHRIIRQLIHFIDNGPAEGFSSGAYCETTGTVFPTDVIWYVDDTKTDKIVAKEITWSGPVPTQILWTLYDTDGSTELATVSDAFEYTSTIFETSHTRTITVI